MNIQRKKQKLVEQFAMQQLAAIPKPTTKMIPPQNIFFCPEHYDLLAKLARKSRVKLKQINVIRH